MVTERTARTVCFLGAPSRSCSQNHFLNAAGPAEPPMSSRCSLWWLHAEQLFVRERPLAIQGCGVGRRCLPERFGEGSGWGLPFTASEFCVAAVLHFRFFNRRPGSSLVV